VSVLLVDDLGPGIEPQARRHPAVPYERSRLRSDAILGGDAL
jgi:hypothetical protein